MSLMNASVNSAKYIFDENSSDAPLELRRNVLRACSSLQEGR